MLNFLNRTLYSGTEKVSSKATPSLEHFKTNVEQVDKKILQPFSTKFKTILKECYSNEEWVEEQSFIEEPIDLGSAARGLTERGIMRGDWGRLAHSTIKEAEGMMRTYSGRLNEDMEASEINEVIQDMPYNFTAGSANTSRLEEDDSIFVEADTTVVEPLSKQTLPKVAELTNQLVEVYNRITEEFTETGIAKVEQVEQPAVLVALGEIISSFNKLIDLSCGALPVEETVIVEEDPLPAIVTGPTTEPIDGEIPPVDAINNTALEEFIEEVLSTNPEFIKYQSMGDSNIDSYLTGDDWIILKFKDGSYYLYNAQSAGETNIEIMKDMAETGSGLNGFINRVVQGGYVEKTIVNEIDNNPGFMYVSNEGLIDTIKSIFNSGPEINLDKKKKAIATLKSTYGDAKWVAEAKLKTGEVKVSSYETFASNDPKAAKANITNAVAKADRHNQKVLDENSKMLAPVVNLFKGNDWQDPKKVATLLAEWKPDVKTNFQEPKWPDNAGTKIKLLDATGIVEAANVIIDVLSNNTKTIADAWLAQYPDLSVNGDIYKHKLSTIKDKDALEDVYLLAKRADNIILNIHAAYDDAKVESTYRVFAIDMLKLMQASISSFPSGSSVENTNERNTLIGIEE
ncbi:virion structural protein [Pseudomonas phage 9Ps-7B]|nr:virion structural protein [Pseudomonas phage 6B]WRQ05985.1 virion structural protein [Pseudomonas phage 9-Ps-8B]WRQ06393.1 virion structural protein [Pseudomonas phage 9Ps-7B]WRQ07154.1 virion structural protein [Pseudomonas phage 14Ps5-6]